MKKTWEAIAKWAVGLIGVFAIIVMIFTIVAVCTFDRADRSVFGYKMLIVMSDSMSATDFDAGDLIFVKETDVTTLKAGDIITYISKASENYGEMVTHKIRRVISDETGKLGFVTYGTTTGVDDDMVVSEGQVVGKYRAKWSGVGRFFHFLKTVPGYLLFILLPFLILITCQVMDCVRQVKEKRAKRLSQIMNERERIKAELEENEEMLRKLEELRNRVETAKNETDI